MRCDVRSEVEVKAHRRGWIHFSILERAPSCPSTRTDDDPFKVGESLLGCVESRFPENLTFVPCEVFVADPLTLPDESLGICFSSKGEGDRAHFIGFYGCSYLGFDDVLVFERLAHVASNIIDQVELSESPTHRTRNFVRMTRFGRYWRGNSFCFGFVYPEVVMVNPFAVVPNYWFPGVGLEREVAKSLMKDNAVRRVFG